MKISDIVTEFTAIPTSDIWVPKPGVLFHLIIQLSLTFYGKDMYVLFLAHEINGKLKPISVVKCS